MPLHDWKCTNGHVFERFVSRDDLDKQHYCECGSPCDRVFLTPPMGWVEADICYDSPIDGRHITSKQKRIEDLARSNCVPYDPDIKQDYQKRIKDEERKLEASVDATVEREIHNMPARKREKLAAELQGGLIAEPTRLTPNVKPMKEDIHV